MKTLIAVMIIAMSITTTAAFSLADEQKGHVCFRVVDTNRDGVVTFEEFKEVYGDEQEKYTSADQNKDGKLTHDEYHVMLGHGAS